MRKNLVYRTLATLFLLLFSLPSFAELFPLKEKYSQAKAGDFIVTEIDRTYSLLFIREITQEHLLLEEIAVPEAQVDLKKIQWALWVQNKAPGHTSWTVYQIDRDSGQLIEAFSYSKKGWLYLDETQQFLSKLLCLPMNLLKTEDRKKIGPQPTHQEEDRRAVWNPPLILNGKKQEKAQFEAFRGVWPEDGTPMSKCAVELYFSQNYPAFPFPYWIEVKSPHYAIRLRAVDSGSGITSFYKGSIPQRKNN